jgi:hypothetical protein
MLRFSRSLFKVRYYNSCQELASQMHKPNNNELLLKINSIEKSIFELKKKLQTNQHNNTYMDTETGTIEDVIENYWKIGGYSDTETGTIEGVIENYWKIGA